jgi:L-threonine-O-3-phosphate decarboxylase
MPPRSVIGAARPLDPHGGNLRTLSQAAGRPASRILDFSANINPLGPVRGLAAALRAAAAEIAHYPDPDNVALIRSIRDRFGWPDDTLVVGNGASELLDAVCRALPCRRALIPVPAYSDYAAAARRARLPVAFLPLRSRDGFAVPWERLAALLRDGDLAILGRPNNPTGALPDAHALRRLARQRPGAWIVADESFLDFVEGAESLADRPPANVVAVRSMTKFYAIPGLRLGFAVARPAVAAALRRKLPPWNVNCMAAQAGIASLADGAYADRTRAFVARARRGLVAALADLPGLRVVPGEANFLLLRMAAPHPDAFDIRDALLRRGIAIRVCANFQGLDRRWFRVAVRTPAENRRLVAALRELVSKECGGQASRRTPSRCAGFAPSHERPSVSNPGS